MTVTIWHNPRCSKSRQTLALLEDKKIAMRIRPYLTDPPSPDEIRNVAALLGLPVIDFARTGERLFRELGLTKTSDDRTLIAAMAKNPILIERPIVIVDGKAAIGRPPEAVLDIL